jgi:hypothetical protein
MCGVCVLTTGFVSDFELVVDTRTHTHTHAHTHTHTHRPIRFYSGSSRRQHWIDQRTAQAAQDLLDDWLHCHRLIRNVCALRTGGERDLRGSGTMADLRGIARYDVQKRVGDGTYGYVNLVRSKVSSNPTHSPPIPPAALPVQIAISCVCSCLRPSKRRLSCLIKHSTQSHTVTHARTHPLWS